MSEQQKLPIEIKLVAVTIPLAIMSLIGIMIYFTINPNKAYELGTLFALIFMVAFVIIIVNLLSRKSEASQ